MLLKALFDVLSEMTCTDVLECTSAMHWLKKNLSSDQEKIFPESIIAESELF